MSAVGRGWNGRKRRALSVAKYCVVIPIVAKTCKLIPNVPLLLDELTSVRSMREEHIGAIVTKRKEMVDLFSSGTKCILMQTGDEATNLRDANKLALLGSFVLNVFARDGAVSVSQAFVIRSATKHVLADSIPLSNESPSADHHYQIELSTPPASLSTLYDAANRAVSKDSSLVISIGRLNSALSRVSLEDRVIDMAISLESIFQSSTEISFRFSLYNALLSEQDVNERYNIQTIEGFLQSS
jgi:hypothetical protein